MSKDLELQKLIQDRRRPEAGTTITGYSRNYRKLGDSDLADGVFDKGHFTNCVVPWSKSARNLDAEIMLIAQDWASEDFIRKESKDRNSLRYQSWIESGFTAGLATNKNLFYLLKNTFALEFKDVYATDAFVFVKPGTMAAKTLPPNDLLRSVGEYAIPQVKIINPRAILCISGAVYNAIRTKLGLPYSSLRNALLERPIKMAGIPVYGLHHTGGLGIVAAGGMKNAEANWAAVAKSISSLG